MALDGIFIKSIVQELQNKIIGLRVDKVNQPEKDEVLLSFKINRKTEKLLISASPNYPRINFTNENKSNPIQAPLFCMILRKYLVGSRVTDITQLNNDRIITITFESSDELGFDSIYNLIIEIMGRHSNITLVRNRDNIVMDSIKHLTADISSYRCLYPGVSYVFPPESTKLNPFNFSENDFAKYFIDYSLSINSKIFANIFTGVSSEISEDILLKLGLLSNIDNLSSEDFIKESVILFLKDYFKNIENNKFSFKEYISTNYRKFHCIDLLALKDDKFLSYDSASKLLDTYYREKDKFDRLNNKSADLLKLVNTNIDRCNKKLRILNRNLKDCEEKEKFRLYGELLTSYIYSFKMGDKQVTVLNYYNTDEEEYLTIPIDDGKTPSENIQSYYKKYTKLKKSEEMATIQIESTEEELNYLSSVLTYLNNIESINEIEELRNELMESGYIKKKRSSKKKVKGPKSLPHHFISSEGIDIYVGKNNIQNDFLTLKFAGKNDIWLHTKEIPGSHVIIKNDSNITDITLREAANLAAFYSKGKDSTKVPVDYTEVKNLKKPNGAKPGMVIYYTNKTFFIDPVEPNLEKVE